MYELLRLRSTREALRFTHPPRCIVAPAVH